MTTFFNSNLKEAIEYFQKSSNVIFSEEFLNCADKKLTPDFEAKTGIKINKHIQFSVPWPDMKVLESGIVSKFNTTLYVNHNWNPITVSWKSKSGRIYDTYDTDIDCDDIEFWFEGLDVVLIHKQMFPKEKLPFKLKNISYELVVTRFNIDCTIVMDLNIVGLKKTKELIREIDQYINNYNISSEKSKQFKGVIHNWKWSIENERLICELDMGSTGFHFFKKLLPFLSQTECLNRVEIC